MMDAPLNLAHQQGRKAELYLNTAKFEEAIDCHAKAVEYLEEAIMTSSDTAVRESLRLQKEFHNKQKEIVQMKKETAERKRKRRIKEQLNVKVTADDQDSLSSDSNSPTGNVDHLIYRTMVETDSLLQFLNTRTNVQRSSSHTKGVKTAFKVPKDDKLIIEELRIHNEELRRHLRQLLSEIDAMSKDNIELKDKLAVYSKDMTSSINSDTFISVAPGGENEIIDDPSSLDLPPLEMPNFEFENSSSE